MSKQPATHMVARKAKKCTFLLRLKQENQIPENFCFLQDVKVVLKLSGGKGLLEAGVLAFDMICAGAGLHSKCVMQS